MLLIYRFKEGVCQDYRLSQCADLVCSLELINQRKQNHESIRSIDRCFISDSIYNKNYRKFYKNLELQYLFQIENYCQYIFVIFSFVDNLIRHFFC